MFDKADVERIYGDLDNEEDDLLSAEGVLFNGKRYYPFECKTCHFKALVPKKDQVYCRRCNQERIKWFSRNLGKIYGGEFKNKKGA